MLSDGALGSLRGFEGQVRERVSQSEIALLRGIARIIVSVRRRSKRTSIPCLPRKRVHASAAKSALDFAAEARIGVGEGEHQ